MRMLAVIFLLIGSLNVAVAQDDPSFWRLHDRGWYWGENPPPAPPPQKPVRILPGGGSGLTKAPALLSAKWFQANLDKYREAAVDNPTQRNVRLYLYLQRVALDKASAFSKAAKLAVYNDPALDQGTYSPTNYLAKATVRRRIDDNERALLTRMAAKSGIWFFFRSDCPYCAAEEPVLDQFARLYGFSILPISLDGKPMPDGRFAEFVNDSGQAAQLGVTATPTLYLVSPPDRVLKIAEGVQAADELADRIVALGHENSWITDAEFASVQSAAPQLLQDGLPADMPTETPAPDALLALLQATAIDGKSTPLTTTPAGPAEE